jgi:hypothetical protein
MTDIYKIPKYNVSCIKHFARNSQLYRLIFILYNKYNNVNKYTFIKLLTLLLRNGYIINNNDKMLIEFINMINLSLIKSTIPYEIIINDEIIYIHHNGD